MTQEDLGKLIGVQKAQISKIENGNNLTLSTSFSAKACHICHSKLKLINKQELTGVTDSVTDR